MDIINTLLATQWPSGLWETIIKWFAGVGSFAIAIILLTLCLKVVLLPLDFWQRSVTRKMSSQQALMKPELDEIQKKYTGQEAQQKQAELYKKYNMNPTGSCLAMLVYMIVTCVIFFTLFTALGNISTYKIKTEYQTLQAEYVSVYAGAIGAGQTDEEAVSTAQVSVATKYDEIKESFLSIKNLWRPDNWSSVFPSSSEYLSSTKLGFGTYNDTTNNIKYIVLSDNGTVPYVDLQNNIYAIDDGTEQKTTITIGENTYNVKYGAIDETYKTTSAASTAMAKEQFSTDFTAVTKGINDEYKGQWNGYLILIFLAGAITFLSQWLSTLGVKAKNKKGETVSGAKPNYISGIFIAVIMVFFTISYTSAFALYIVANSLISMLFTY